MSSPHDAVDSRTVFKPDIFKGKVLFCTGGGSGICKAMTEAMMHHGANAVIVGRNRDRLEQAAKDLSKATGQQCIPAQADVRDPQSLKDAVAKTIVQLGRIDFVICGAAGNFLAPISALSENAFKTVIEIDTLGSFNTVKATLSHVRASKGSYIFVSATLHYRGTPYQAHVSAAKAGIDALSAVVAIEEGPHSVRSNVIAPGATAGTQGQTRLTGRSMSDGTKKTFPTGRYGDVKDMANATVFLFSDAASYITGQVLVVDGAWESLRPPFLPYPESVVDPDSFNSLKPKL
ncbi:hypothetical protein M378DRAFT_105231 [Amanita muscaria Koide BX008]|uniref:2,4-dienoyl-CoA reductase [(3E)-enoyl-CoA-producing] n=1 Tax=Amanita muscaria (strain Koide BX008) TaxID=946122 RepID=A0A0C2SPT6_AMAMK|nr:hypothetical protein M378DRAFT_105231 [Amanita muscaria Koide BX008]